MTRSAEWLEKQTRKTEIKKAIGEHFTKDPLKIRVLLESFKNSLKGIETNQDETVDEAFELIGYWYNEMNNAGFE